MEVARIAIGVLGIGVAAYGFYGFTSVTTDDITLTNAALHPMGDAYVLVGQINNPGAPDRLTGIGSDAAARALLVRNAVVVPGDSTPVLAMDGTHGVLMGLHGEVAEGRLIPVSLWFDKAGQVTARVRVELQTMNHTQKYTVPPEEPQPSLDIDVYDEDGTWYVRLMTSDFTFAEDAVDTPHQPGRGHGHVYLNGLKLSRVYDRTARLGVLPSGSYVAHVTLNTNDHRVYAVEGADLSVRETFSVP